jgi:manganese transport protein
MHLRDLVRAIGVLGPAVLVSVELFDPASIVTDTASGASFGFAILWAALYSGMLLIVVQEASARLGVVTGKTLAENIYTRYSKRYSYLFFAASVFLDFATLTAEVIGLSLAISFASGLPYTVSILASILIIGLFVFVLPYHLLEKIIMFLVLAVFIAYGYFLLALKIPLGTIVFNSLVPSFDAHSFYSAEAIIGATIMPTYVILHSGLVCEKGWIHDHHKPIDELVSDETQHVESERIDSVFSLFMGTILNIMIIASAAVLLAGRQVENFFGIALPFYNSLGTPGLALFAITFACAGIAAVVTVGLGSVYNTLGFLGFEERLGKRRFKLVFILWLVIAGMASVLPNPVGIMVFTQYLNAVLLPLILLPLLFLTMDGELMGNYRLGRGMVFLISVIILMTAMLFLVNLGSLITGVLH